MPPKRMDLIVSVVNRALLKWLPLAITSVMVIGCSYVFVQQAYRHGADDPQTAMACEAAAGIGLGNPAQKFVPETTVDPSSDLNAFLIVIGPDKKVVKSSLALGSASPIPPSGTLAAASDSGENRVTWQPRSDTRIAAVIEPINGGRDGWVVAGRSLSEVEARVDQLTQLAALGLVATLVLTFAASLATVAIKDRVKPVD